jgi:hypothetical protein
MTMMHRNIYLTLVAFLLLLNAPATQAMERFARLGVGFTNQLRNDLPAISFKIQRSKSFALGGQFAYSNDETKGGYAAGLKLYRNLFDEPHLTFYGSVLAAVISRNRSASESVSGFQFDFTLGSEFSFPGLDSLGFSVEFGASLNKLDDFVVETVGDSFLVSAVHFYL